MTAPVIVWLYEDLRLSDHPALHAAAISGRPLIVCYVHDESTPGARAPASASRWWLHHSLHSLQQSLHQHGGQLWLARGPIEQVLARLVTHCDAAALYFSRGYQPWKVSLEQRLHQRFSADGLEVRRFTGTLLFQPEHIRTRTDTPFKVFTPFWKTCLGQPEPAAELPVPKLSFAPVSIASEALEDWSLLPVRPDWAGGLRAHWQPGEAGAKARLAQFADEAISHYSDGRDVPAAPGTSQLSAHLHFGEISPRQLWHFVRDHASAGGGSAAYLRQLGWRDFSHHLLFHWPHIASSAFKPAYNAFPWVDDQDALSAWQRGQTGFPIVDAGMRELWQTGWMHNRVRMIAASFLVKHLLVPWQRGEQWFWDTLVDADLANNCAGWQWVAGCGADASPYFRVFNPILQGEKFDPQGSYVRRWVPELAGLPSTHIHQPWAADAATLARAGIHLGTQYPLPLVEHSIGRQRALDALKTFKQIQAAGP